MKEKEITPRRNKAPASASRGQGKRTKESETLTTAIHIRRDHWELLREVAFNRARASGGRASVSAVIAELIEHQRTRLTREIDNGP